MTERHRKALHLWLTVRFAFSTRPSETTLVVFRWADRRLARVIRKAGPIVTPRRRFEAERCGVEKRWRVKEVRAEWFGQEQWHEQGQKGAA